MFPEKLLFCHMRTFDTFALQPSKPSKTSAKSIVRLRARPEHAPSLCDSSVTIASELIGVRDDNKYEKKCPSAGSAISERIRRQPSIVFIRNFCKDSSVFIGKNPNKTEKGCNIVVRKNLSSRSSASNYPVFREERLRFFSAVSTG